MKNLIQLNKKVTFHRCNLPGLWLLMFLFFMSSCFAGIKLQKISSIPFDMIGNYVVIQVKINDSPPLNLILDSGIRNTLITELFPGDGITLTYSDVKELMGLGGGTRLEAYSSNFNTLKIGKISMTQKTVYVLKEDVFNISKHTGSKINGIIGVDFFEGYIIEINYSSKRINFYKKNELFQPPKGYGLIPLIIEGKKMFMELTVLQSDSTHKKVKMLLDTGAELNGWFQSFKKESVHIPGNSVRGIIGQGLNGEIAGVFGRLPKICFGDFCLNNVIVSFPDSSSISDIVSNSARDGTIGSQILSRFNLIIDFDNRKLYFKPNYNYDKPFIYNVAGIEIMQIIPFIPQTEVWLVWENSPAAIAGVKAGDKIIEVNGQKAFQFEMGEIKRILETPSKRPLTLTLLRDEKEIYVSIDMKSKL